MANIIYVLRKVQNGSYRDIAFFRAGQLPPNDILRALKDRGFRLDEEEIEPGNDDDRWSDILREYIEAPVETPAPSEG